MDITAITIRKAACEESYQLQAIARQTFSESFSSTNEQTNIERYLNESFSLDQLSSELVNKNSEFYFALVDDRIVGYLKLNVGAAQTELKAENGLEIERIYVLKEFHGKNIGQLLFQKAIEMARQAHVEYVWLGVWEDNPRAINFYRKNGFVEFDKHIFRLGNEEQTDLMMKLLLHAPKN
jgi:diamine N-acetyltransferase